MSSSGTDAADSVADGAVSEYMVYAMLVCGSDGTIDA